MKTIKGSVVARGKQEEKMNTQSTENKDNENVLHDIIMMDLYHYTFVQNHRMYNAKSETKVNYELECYDVSI